MKKLTLILLLFLCFSCEDSQVNITSTPKSDRIKLIEKTYMVSRGFFIIEVDKHLYLSCSDGGIVHLESCPCKNK